MMGFLTFALLLFYPFVASAITVGGNDLTLAEPDGFFQVTDTSSWAWKIAEKHTPSINRLLAVYVTAEDFERNNKGGVPVLDRYINVQIHRKAEKVDISTARLKDVADGLKQNKSTDEVILSLMNNSSQKSADSYGLFSGQEPETSVPLGVFAQGDRYFTYGSIFRYQKFSVVGAATLVLVDSRLLYLFVMSKYDSAEDIEWGRTFSGGWINKIIQH